MKLTTEIFIERATTKHGNKYDYSDSVYTLGKNLIVITCPEHGKFSQKALLHLKGQGCRKCGFITGGKKQRLTTKDFIEQSQLVHGNLYDYSLSDYTHALNKVKIICKQHGEFLQKPHMHMNGSGCNKCGIETTRLKTSHTTETFVKKANIIHDGFYNYDKTDYTSAHKKIIITCPIHGDFKQVPYSHLQGHKCFDCKNMRGWKEADWIKFCESKNIEKTILYLLKCSNEVEIFLKVGMSSSTVQERFKQSKMPYTYESILEITGSPKQTFNTERHVLQSLHSYKYKPQIEFNGYTECFSIEALPEIQKLLQLN